MININKLWPVFLVWVALVGWIGLLFVFGDETAASTRRPALCGLLYALAAPGPFLVGGRRWRGVRGFILPSLLTLAAVAGLGAAFSFGAPADVARGAWPLVVSESTPLTLALLSGVVLGVVLLSLVQNRAVCITCNRPIRLWHSPARCQIHPDRNARFHGWCLQTAPDDLFLSHDKADLEQLVAVSRGAAPQTPGNGQALCRTCLRGLAHQALHAHVQHSDFLVPHDHVLRKQLNCAHCGNAAPTASDDSEEVSLEINHGPLAGQGEAVVERFKLGPMIRCPHCGTPAHLTCWLSRGGCPNHGGADARGKQCSMGGQEERAVAYATKGWRRLCKEHAQAAGWSIRGGRHRPIPMPVAPNTRKP